MRTGGYRHEVWGGEGGREEVHDYQVDPEEFTNRINTPVAAALRAQFARGWRAARA